MSFSGGGLLVSISILFQRDLNVLLIESSTLKARADEIQRKDIPAQARKTRKSRQTEENCFVHM